MSRPLRVGVQLPEVERFVPWPELIAMARSAEAVGFDSSWLGDHLLYDLPDGTTRGPWEVWTSLAALVAVTDRVTLGPLVASTSFHAPAMLAKQAATVDAISGGRLVLGIGAGWNEREGRADLDARYYRVEDCVLAPRPVRPGGPPLMLGSVRPRCNSCSTRSRRSRSRPWGRHCGCSTWTDRRSAKVRG